jgi:hypothetical protein
MSHYYIQVALPSPQYIIDDILINTIGSDTCCGSSEVDTIALLPSLLCVMMLDLVLWSPSNHPSLHS